MPFFEIFIAFVFITIVGVVLTLLASGILIWFAAIFKEMFDFLTGRAEEIEEAK
jgi:cellulose synthase/poly-beta-1,6-N-acetylglucosamine synthase-like glycosyltransferase